MENAQYRWNPEVVMRAEGEEAFLFNADTAGFIVVNETSRFIWERCEAGADVAKIADALVEEYDVEYARAKEDAEAHVKELAERAFLVAS